MKGRLAYNTKMEIAFLDHQIKTSATTEQKEYHTNNKNNFLQKGFKSYDLLDKTEETENKKFYKEISQFIDEGLDKNFIKPLVSIANVLFPEKDRLPNGIGFKLFEFINGNTPHQLEELSKLKPHLVLFLYENHSILTSYFKMEPQEGAQFLEEEFLKKAQLLKKAIKEEKEKIKVLLGKRLSKAITEGNIEEVKKLVKHSIEQGIDLQNALDLALENKHDEVVKILLEAMQSRPTV